MMGYSYFRVLVAALLIATTASEHTLGQLGHVDQVGEHTEKANSLIQILFKAYDSFTVSSTRLAPRRKPFLR
jgi:hypothetical protein